MPSQLDLDQGGTARQFVRTNMGPSIGFVDIPAVNPFPITAAGTYQLNPDTTLVLVNVAGAVTITLPSSINPLVPAGVLPARFANQPITIVDVGGNGAAHPITIQPFQGTSETVMGLASISISVNYGGFTLTPSSVQKTWTSVSP